MLFDLYLFSLRIDFEPNQTISWKTNILKRVRVPSTHTYVSSILSWRIDLKDIPRGGLYVHCKSFLLNSFPIFDFFHFHFFLSFASLTLNIWNLNGNCWQREREKEIYINKRNMMGKTFYIFVLLATSSLNCQKRFLSKGCYSFYGLNSDTHTLSVWNLKILFHFELVSRTWGLRKDIRNRISGEKNII